MLSTTAMSQSTAEVEKQAIITQARRQLVALSSPSGKLYETCSKKNVKGDFVVDLTIQGKGDVLTVFMVSSSTGVVNDQNFLKSQLAELRFEDIKIPKKERIKFRHTLTF